MTIGRNELEAIRDDHMSNQPQPRLLQSDLRHVTTTVPEHALARYWPCPNKTEENRAVVKKHGQDSVAISLLVAESLEAVSTEPVWKQTVWPAGCLEDQTYEDAWVRSVVQDFTQMYLSPWGGRDIVVHQRHSFALVVARAQLALAIHVAECLDLGDTSLLRNHQGTLVGSAKDSRSLLRPEESRPFLAITSCRVDQHFKPK